MPELCRFYGIVIRMFWEDHPPPHFHAIYGNHEALIEIDTSETIAGSLPLGADSLVRQWTALHRSDPSFFHHREFCKSARSNIKRAEVGHRSVHHSDVSIDVGLLRVL